jgi:hypothetical protein
MHLPGIAPLENAAPEEVDRFRQKILQLTAVASLARLPQVAPI